MTHVDICKKCKHSIRIPVNGKQTVMCPYLMRQGELGCSDDCQYKLEHVLLIDKRRST